MGMRWDIHQKIRKWDQSTVIAIPIDGDRVSLNRDIASLTLKFPNH